MRKAVMLSHPNRYSVRTLPLSTYLLRLRYQPMKQHQNRCHIIIFSYKIGSGSILWAIAASTWSILAHLRLFLWGYLPKTDIFFWYVQKTHNVMAHCLRTASQTAHQYRIYALEWFKSTWMNDDHRRGLHRNHPWPAALSHFTKLAIQKAGSCTVTLAKACQEKNGCCINCVKYF